MQRFKHILCVMEHGDAGAATLQRAVALAENNQASLTVIDVVARVASGIGMHDCDPMLRDLHSAEWRDREARIAVLLEPYRHRQIAIRHTVLPGITFVEVIREVLRNGHDLVIKCPESPSWLKRVFSSDDMHLLRKCPCPVWMVKPNAPKTYKRILAAVDIDAGYPAKELAIRQRLNARILEVAASLAISESAQLHVACAWESLAEQAQGRLFALDVSSERLAQSVAQEQLQQQRVLDALVNNRIGRGNATRDAVEYLQPRTHLLKGSARAEIPALATRLAIDCIVMGTVARTGVRGFIIGNTAEAILAQVECSVLAIKPEGFATPVALAD